MNSYVKQKRRASAVQTEWGRVSPAKLGRVACQILNGWEFAGFALDDGGIYREAISESSGDHPLPA
jgi:hypothetical protein